MIEALSTIAVVFALVSLGLAIVNSARTITGRLDTQNMLLDKIARKLDRAGEGG